MKLDILIDKLVRVGEEHTFNLDVDLVIEYERDGEVVQVEMPCNDVAISRPNGNVKICHMKD